MHPVYKYEKPLFLISVIFSAIVWLLLVLVTFGVALLVLLILYLLFLFAHSAFISHIRGNGVKINKEQFPDLHDRLVKSCQKIGLRDVPDAYLLRMDFFNALATRFLGRNYIVLFTDVIDALEDQPGAIDFYIGHELGHIHRKHLLWQGFLAPSAILPLLGAALRRAEEYTCDRYGVICTGNEEDIKAAIAAIAAGDTRWKSINADAYMAQVAETKGFWMSYNELTNDYPWMTKRMATALANKQGLAVKHPRRHFIAFLLAAITPRLGPGGAASAIVTIAMIGILAAVAVPAYQDYVTRAGYAEALLAGREVQRSASEFILINQEIPVSLADLGLSAAGLTNSEAGYAIDIYEGGLIGIDVGADNMGQPRYIVLEPILDQGTVEWVCYGENIASSQLPVSCN